MKENISYKDLIDSWETFLQTGGNGNLKDFARFVLAREEKADEPLSATAGSQAAGPYLTAEAGEIISRLYKFARYYSKPVLQPLGLNSLDEFVIMAALANQEESSKKSLIQDNLIELTTGMDMIRRLVKQGYLQEKVNPADKREKLVSLSKQGASTLFSIVQQFARLEDVLGDLSSEERYQLILLLRRLDTFHTRRVNPAP